MPACARVDLPWRSDFVQVHLHPHLALSGGLPRGRPHNAPSPYARNWSCKFFQTSSECARLRPRLPIPAYRYLARIRRVPAPQRQDAVLELPRGEIDHTSRPRRETMVSLHACLLAAALAGQSDSVLLSFTADWCGHCRLMQPTVQRLLDAGYPIREVNIDKNPDLASQFGVRPIPCFVLVRDGREVDRVVGEASYDRLVQMFAQPGRPASPAAPQAVSLAAPGDANVRGQSPDDGSAPRVPLPPLAGSVARHSGPAAPTVGCHGRPTGGTPWKFGPAAGATSDRASARGRRLGRVAWDGNDHRCAW